MCSSITRPYFRVGTYINSLKNCHVLHTKFNFGFTYILTYSKGVFYWNFLLSTISENGKCVYNKASKIGLGII